MIIKVMGGSRSTDVSSSSSVRAEWSMLIVFLTLLCTCVQVSRSQENYVDNKAFAALQGAYEGHIYIIYDVRSNISSSTIRGCSSSPIVVVVAASSNTFLVYRSIG